MSAHEYMEWTVFYGMDPWGEQRADMRMARIAAATVAPHSKSRIDQNDFMLFPDEANEISENVGDDERAAMLFLKRLS